METYEKKGGLGMERKLSKRALEVAEQIKKDYIGIQQIDIYFGRPDARFKKCWWAFTRTENGISLDGTYGHPLRMSDSLSGLAIEGRYEHPGCGSC